VVHDIVEDGRSAVLCTHRPALPTIVDALATYGSTAQASLLNSTLTLAPGDLTVVHMTPAKAGGKRKIVAIETYTPGPPAN
jgi:8-oxo-dGTP diphosphatase